MHDFASRILQVPSGGGQDHHPEALEGGDGKVTAWPCNTFEMMIIQYKEQCHTFTMAGLDPARRRSKGAMENNLLGW